MKIIVAGNGKIGSSLTSQLASEGYDITIIDSDKDVLEEGMESYDVMSVQGNCATMAVLKDAGVESADLLIAATGADEVNLLCCMTAHGMNPRLHTIARIRNPEYADQALVMRNYFGLSMVFNPDKQAATEIYRLLKYPGFLKRDTFAKGRVEIVELKVQANSVLNNLPLIKLNSAIKTKILVCAVLRGGSAIIPAGDFVMKEGDRIFVTASSDNLSALLKNLGIITHKARRVLLAGGSRISYYLAGQLESDGVSVEIIERKKGRCEQLSATLPDVNIIEGDASNQQFLDREGIESCDAFVTLTGVDETNMVMSIYGTTVGVPQVITKLGRAENVRILDSLPIGSIISPKDLSCSDIVRYVRAMQNRIGAAVTMHTIADNLVEALEFIVDDKTENCGIALKDIQLKKNVLIACMTRRGQTFFPTGDSAMERGDTVIVVSGGDNVIRQLNDIFE